MAVANSAHLSAPAQLSWRSQYVLDIANPDAFAHVFGQIDALITRLSIDFIKWDHNRDLVEPVHNGRPGTHAQTMALYQLIRDLKAAHTGLEIESCSSGGARSDLGILDVTDRVWVSDSNDPVERQEIQRWTQLLLPPELVGAHVGPKTAHSSGRTTSLTYRLATSLMGSAGFEWNIADCGPEERETITRWATLYEGLRHVIHTGSAVPETCAIPPFASQVQSRKTFRKRCTCSQVSQPRRTLCPNMCGSTDSIRIVATRCGCAPRSASRGTDLRRPAGCRPGASGLPGTFSARSDCRSRHCGRLRQSSFTPR
jgi:hypothetical protein